MSRYSGRDKLKTKNPSNYTFNPMPVEKDASASFFVGLLLGICCKTAL